MLVQCWASVADGGTPLYRRWLNVLCLLVIDQNAWLMAGTPDVGKNVIGRDVIGKIAIGKNAIGKNVEW